MSPAQTFLAHNSVARLQHTLRTLHALGVHRPSEITLPIEELECLAIAASPVLGIDPRQFDQGGWHDETGAPVATAPVRLADEIQPAWHTPT